MSPPARRTTSTYQARFVSKLAFDRWSPASADIIASEYYPTKFRFERWEEEGDSLPIRYGQLCDSLVLICQIFRRNLRTQISSPMAYLSVGHHPSSPCDAPFAYRCGLGFQSWEWSVTGAGTPVMMGPFRNFR
jgi:hypothetical protein